MEENKKSLKMPIIILVAVLVILLVGAIVYVTNNNKPKNIFMGAIDSVLESGTEQEEIKTMNLTMGLGININSDNTEIAKAAEYINKAKFTVNAQMDLEQEKELVKIGVDYDNDKVLDAKISYKNQEDNMYAKVEELFDKAFAITVDEEMKEQFKSLFEETKSLYTEESKSSKKATEILKDSISNRLKDEYFSQENVELDVEGEKVNTRKSVLTLTTAQLQEVLSGIITDLKDNEEFINCFKEEDREEIKNTLNDLETSVNEMTSDEDEYIFSVLKTDEENYKLVASQKVEGEESEVLNCTLTIKKVDDNTTDIAIKVNVEGVGEVTVNLQVSYIINEPIEDIDTSNSVDINELTEEDQQKIMTNLQNMKIYTIIQDIITAYSSNTYSSYEY